MPSDIKLPPYKTPKAWIGQIVVVYDKSEERWYQTPVLNAFTKFDGTWRYTVQYGDISQHLKDENIKDVQK